MKNFVFAILFLAGCSNRSSNTNNGVTVSDSLTAQSINRSDINHSCCFQTEKDFLPFFPDSSADFRPDNEPRLIEMKCITDTMLVSNSARGYFDADGKMIVVTINDYCTTGEQQLFSDYDGMMHAYKDDKSVSEFNEFEEPGQHYGFACYVPVNDIAVLSIVVDKRFIVEIIQHEATSTKSVMKMLEYVPVKELAMFRK